MDVKKIEEIFNRARIEMFLPAIKFDYTIKDNVSFKTSIKQASVTTVIPENILKDPEGEKILLWGFRHILAHVHYCPYDIKTARELEELIHRELRNTNLAQYSHNILWLFADLQIDLVYLPRIFGSQPYHLKYIYRKEPKGLELLKYSAYKVAYGDFIPDYSVNPLVMSYGKYIARAVLTPRPWSSKVIMLTRVIRRFLAVKKLNMEKLNSLETHLPLKEDIRREGMNELMRAGAYVSDEAEAKNFFEKWVAPRMKDQVEQLLRQANEVLRRARGKRSIKKALRERITSLTSDSQYSTESGEEPRLRTSMSKPLGKLSRKKFMDSLWRSFWYRALAEDIVIEFIVRRGLPKPTWMILSYPDEWTAEDDIEELDVEGSTEEGPLLPEVTTIRWIRRGSLSGQELSSGYAPSLIIVLDSSRSMMDSFNDAALAAFIIFLSAKKAGGKSAVITFSTKYLLADWNAPDDIKQIFLATRLGEYTILPTHAFLNLIHRISEPVFLTIITDGGWQNFDEAIKDLKEIANLGHEIVIFHLYGWRYPERITKLSSLNFIRFYHLDKPQDLKKIAIEESYRKYGIYLAPQSKF